MNITDAKPNDALRTVGTASLEDLAAMTRAEVAALPEPARAARVERLLADRQTLWRLDDYATAANLSKAAPIKWRNANLQSGKTDENALPADDATPPGSRTPYWWAGTGRLWLLQSTRVDADLFPREDGKGRKPSGRPPAPRAGA